MKPVIIIKDCTSKSVPTTLVLHRSRRIFLLLKDENIFNQAFALKQKHEKCFIDLGLLG